MSNKPMRVIVTTSDRYHKVLRLFIHMFNKYWSPHQPVLVAGFRRPDYDFPSNFEFLSLGEQAYYPKERWSDACIKACQTIPDEVFCLLLDDYLLTRPVNIDAVGILYRYMLQFRDVVKVDLCEDRLYAHGADIRYDTVSYLDLVKSMPGSPYHMSLWPGLWRREHLLRVLIPNESAQEIELQGTPRLAHMQELRVLGTRQSPLRICNAVRYNAGDDSLDLTGGNSADYLKDCDIKELKDMGLL